MEDVSEEPHVSTDGTADDDSSEDVDIRRERQTVECGEAFAEQIINCYLDNLPLSAMMVCLLCHWAVGGGLIRYASKL